MCVSYLEWADEVVLFEFGVVWALVEIVERWSENGGVPEGLEDDWDEAVELAVVVDHTEVVVVVRRGLLQAGNDSAGLLWLSAKHISYFRFILTIYLKMQYSSY